MADTPAPREPRAPRAPRVARRPQRPAPRAPHPLLVAYFEAIDRGLPPASDARRASAPEAPLLLLSEVCGPDGAALPALARQLQAAEAEAEALVLVHPVGLARLARDRAEAAARLPGLLGSAERAAQLIDQLQRCGGPAEREAALLAAAHQLLAEQTNMPYITLFWVEDLGGRTASHALIHCTAQAARFRLIKDLMWSLADARPGLRARAIDPTGPTPPPASREAQAETLIKRACHDGPRPVSHFTRALPEQPDILLAPKQFKHMLLLLEAARHLRVLDKDGSGRPLPAAKRPKRQGVPTLGDDFWVELA